MAVAKEVVQVPMEVPYDREQKGIKPWLIRIAPKSHARPILLATIPRHGSDDPGTAATGGIATPRIANPVGLAPADAVAHGHARCESQDDMNSGNLSDEPEVKALGGNAMRVFVRLP